MTGRKHKRQSQAGLDQSPASLSRTERALRLKHRDDLLYYAPRALKIRTKIGDIKPLRLNDAQAHIHRILEDQLKETGRVRAIILKGRQQGCSTYVQARYFWKVTHRPGVRAFIMTHVEEASANLFSMVRRFHEHCPDALRPSSSLANARELLFDRLDSGYRVGTAGARGAGRSDTIQYFHGSEVAYWPHAREHIAGALQAVPDAPGTEVILESTAAGPGGLFHDLVMEAHSGQSPFQLIFVPWYWQREYVRPVPPGFEPSAEEMVYGDSYLLTPGQMAWRRYKMRELGGLHNFRREYPASLKDAFNAEIKGALWTRAMIDAAHVTRAPQLARIVVALDPSGGGGARHDEAGIIVAGLGHDGRYYVLADLSARLSPAAWAKRAIEAYHHHAADRIIAERNFGGDMVAQVLRQADPQVPISLVTASRGKDVRAEPVAALYEQGRVGHVGRHIALEDELATWVPTDRRSPNRLDALVWAITALANPQNAGLSFA